MRRNVWVAGEGYEPYIGRWSRLAAVNFIDALGVDDGAAWLDVGSGTGALSATILERAAPLSVLGIDPSEAFVAYASEHVPGASFEVGDGQALPAADASFDAVVGGLMLNFVPEPPRCIAEMVRVTKRGGVVAVYVWDYAGKMELMRYFWDAAVAMDPTAQDEGPRFPLCAPEPLARLFEDAGLQDVEVRPIDIETRFRDFDDYWQPFLGGQGPAPAHAMSLDERSRDALRDRIRAALPIAEDGSISLIARAWAARGSA